MTGPFADCLFRFAFVLAGGYSLAFGLWTGVWPSAFFELLDLAPPRYAPIWACLGMVVGVYGLLRIDGRGIRVRSSASTVSAISATLIRP